MSNLTGRHWIFIIGIISALIASRWSQDTASDIVVLLFFIGIGLFLKSIFS